MVGGGGYPHAPPRANANDGCYTACMVRRCARRPRKGRRGVMLHAFVSGNARAGRERVSVWMRRAMRPRCRASAIRPAGVSCETPCPFGRLVNPRQRREAMTETSTGRSRTGSVGLSSPTAPCRVAPWRLLVPFGFPQRLLPSGDEPLSQHLASDYNAKVVRLSPLAACHRPRRRPQIPHRRVPPNRWGLPESPPPRLRGDGWGERRG